VALPVRVLALVALCAGCGFDTGGISFPEQDSAPLSPDAVTSFDSAATPDAVAPDARSLDAIPAQLDALDSFCPSTLDLVGCYRFENNGDDGSLSNADAQLTAVSWDYGVDGQAVVTDAASVILVPEHIGLDVPALTVELWVRATAFPVNSDRAGLVDDDGQYGLFVYAGGEIRCSCAGQAVSYQSLEPNVWTHLACTYDPIAGLLLYIDGDEEASAPANGMPSTSGTTGLSIGGNNPSGDPFTGAIDNVRIWNRARSASEICAVAGSC